MSVPSTFPRITGAQFQRIVASIRPDANADAIGKGRAVIVTSEQGTPLANVYDVRNLSPYGIDFAMARPLKVGTKLLMCLTDGKEQHARAMVCRVARWSPIAPNDCTVHAIFEKEVASPFPQSEIKQAIEADELRRLADSNG